MSITKRIERLEQQVLEQDERCAELDAETLRAMLRMATMDDVGVDLCRLACVMKDSRDFPLRRVGPYRHRQETIDEIERLEIPALIKTEEGRRKATEIMRAEAHARWERAVVEKFGKDALAKLYAFWQRGGR
jgi:hypothetical protein